MGLEILENLENKNNNHLEYKNKAELEVTACGKTHTLYSNEVEAKKVVIRIEKEQCRQCVFKGDELDYTIKICNDSLIDIDNPLFSDDIPDGLEYVMNSFKVDGSPKTPTRYDNKLSYHLGTIKAGHEVIITFNTIVS